MNRRKMSGGLFLMGGIIITLFFLGAKFAPAVKGILAGLVLIEIFLGIFLLERQTKKGRPRGIGNQN